MVNAGTCAMSTPATTRRISCGPDGSRHPFAAGRHRTTVRRRNGGRDVSGHGLRRGHRRVVSRDVLLAYTDGVPEAHSPENEEFGEERLQLLLRQTAHLPVDDISARISAEMRNWIRDAEQYDDLTFIVMKVRAS
jgi:hypothetical protein